MIERLRSGGIQFEAATDPQLSQSLVGKSVVVTGTLRGLSREQAEAAIISRGGKSPGSVSAKTTAVVAGDSPGREADQGGSTRSTRPRRAGIRQAPGDRRAAIDGRLRALHRSRATNRYPFSDPHVERSGTGRPGHQRPLPITRRRRCRCFGPGLRRRRHAAWSTRRSQASSPALAGDATFLRKFQAEARLAASLNHRNVLHVYDWGDENGVPILCWSTSGAAVCGPCWTPSSAQPATGGCDRR